MRGVPTHHTFSIARIGSRYFPDSDTPVERQQKLDALLGLIRRHRRNTYCIQQVDIIDGVVKATAYLQEEREEDEQNTDTQDSIGTLQ
jgi:hypothetical protein